MRLRPLLLPILFIALGTIVALAVGEVAIRLLAANAPASELRGLHSFRPDLPWLYELRPGAEGRLSETGDALYRINEDGFRDARHARPKPDGVFRVVVMGDSISFGYGVEETEAYPQVLEALLAERVSEPAIEIVNLGVGGYNAYNEAALLEGVGVGYEPDLVLVQFCINDLNDPTVHFDAQTRLAFSSIPDAAFPDPSLRRASEHAPSGLLRWCRVSKLCAASHDVWLAANEPEFDDRALRDATSFIESADRPEWDWLEGRYVEMAQVARAHGAGFAILAFPYRSQLKGSAPHPVQNLLIELGRRHGWPVIDPLPAFRKARRERTPLFDDWWHPKAAGHRIAAVETARALACGGQLGEPARAACDADD